MPFGLKSAQATYQRCVQNCLHNQIGRNVHAYVDDIVVKSRKKETLIDDSKETFDNLRVYKMMLNPAKCVCGVLVGKLLGFLVSNRGIEANPEKIKAITSLAKPACVNDVQRLAGRIAALSRFISRLGEKAIPLYQMMKKTYNFVWSDAANAAFEDLKKQLAEPPVLAAPVDKEPLLLYVAANARAVSVAIVVERKEAAEYEALLHGLRMAKEMNLSWVRCFGDSDLVAQQVSGTWDSKDPLMAAYR
ncbi:unnamed protein product [Triticum aestivum]|uniref:Uncharacterized protein n=1 Tax=Triticum aestivum TaxID=4565 RepID=A0A7H4LGS6_WHEAT|nr:unnamed protein product [Triticum aestivum]